MTPTAQMPLGAGPTMERIDLEKTRRNLFVQEVTTVTPGVLRVTLAGDELEGFRSLSPDDNVKLFFPTPNDEVASREYTPRQFDAVAKTLAIDFVLHQGGVGASWAQQAKPGDSLLIGGPRKSSIIHANGAWWLLIGDETAVPSIGRRLEEMPATAKVVAIITVTGVSEQQHFETKADLTLIWIHRPSEQAADPKPLLEALKQLELPAGPGFFWIAAEGGVVRELRSHAVDVLHHPAEFIKASGYWTASKSTEGS